MKVDASIFSIVLLIIAVVFFVLATVKTLARGWMVPLGLAAFAGSFLVTALL